MQQTPPRQYRESIHGFITSYLENARLGVYYLRNDLSPAEARVFFDQAKQKGQAEFEDEQENNYTLVYNRDGTYTLVYRGRSR